LAIPTYEQLFLPLLQFASDGREHSSREALDPLSKNFKMSDDEINQTLQNGRSVFHNRLAWAHTYLKQAGLIRYTKRGFFQITKRGLDVINQNPLSLDIEFLHQFPEFIDFSNRTKKNIIEAESTTSKREMTPEEMMDSGYELMQEKLNDELLLQ
jgi:restriction system protein